ncbi:hypothetical protein ASZ90_017855 [hydrocarbon metagenome]|uniref:Uncharacterized protein n=1 Tax=hydrocarbon metagenome TaxID=938273 RepID=A0A0W8E822_9ZZZZ
MNMQESGGTNNWGEFSVHAGIGRPFSPNPSANLVGQKGGEMDVLLHSLV